MDGWHLQPAASASATLPAGNYGAPRRHVSRPAQLAVDKIFGIAKTLLSALYDLWSSDRVGFFFSSSSGLSVRHLSKIGNQLRICNAYKLRQSPRQFDA